jgi:hypothetical protein
LRVFILPGGGFRLTPLRCDVDAAYARCASNTPQENATRHVAENAGVPGDVVREQLKKLADMAPCAIESVTKNCPLDFHATLVPRLPVALNSD